MKYTREQIENMLAKARILGKDIEQLKTQCGHAMYLLRDVLDGVTILYIPDDVECAEEEKVRPYRIFEKPAPTYCYVEYKTLIVSGGRNLRSAFRMFCECSAQSIDLSSLDTSNITDMSLMFYNCKTQSLDLSNFDTSKVTNMSDMFLGCKAQSLDISSFDTSKVTDMSAMFNHCETQSIDLSSFDTSNVTSMHEMFRSCKAQSLDLSNFDTSRVTGMRYMFRDCEAQCLDISSFDTSSVTDMLRMCGMFKDCYAEVKATDPKILEELNRR